MASSSQSSNFVINFHRGGSLTRNPLSYDFEILSKVENVDLSSMDFEALVTFIGEQFSGVVKSLFYLLPGKDLDSGLRCLNSDADLKECVECGTKNECALDIYLSTSVFELNDATASIDHLSDNEEEVLEVRTKKAAPKPRHKSSKLFDTTFLTTIYNALEREEFVDKDIDQTIEDYDMEGEHYPIHDPNIKWNLMTPVLG
ncbi:hypothetical protein CTI12_AA614600 [Artemisia annua]|uniref:PB1-like domain-containing protein n=1 Tax=Artemisia annua TaxID=35608 RepID=A0A2U1KDQ7_ARTAN|nr:hypothetical protein CTI12_AA614600 [Artemisia annua]